MEIKLKKRSKLKRIFYIPKLFISQYKLSRKHTNRAGAFKIALAFVSLIYID